MNNLINHYNRDLDDYVSNEKTIEEIKSQADSRFIKWTSTLINSLKQQKRLVFDELRIRQVLYRPFVKLWLYEDARILSNCRTISSMFPKDSDQEAVSITGGSNNGATDSVLATKTIPDLASIGPGRGGGRAIFRRS